MISKFTRMPMRDMIAPILALLFFVEMGSFFIISSASKVKILILHSYTPEYSWTEGINNGIDRILSDKKWIGNKWIDISYHYMATKNADATQKRRAQKNAHRGIENVEPDILIAIDDNANSLVAKEYVNSRKMNIIFAGANGSVAPYGYENASNVTGIYEHKPVAALVELIDVINKYEEKTVSVVFVSDKSSSAQLDAEHMKQAYWGKVSYEGHISVDSFSEWKKVILNLPDNIDYVLVGGYRKLKLLDGSNRRASSTAVAHWTAKNSTPIVLGLNVFNSEDGVPISVGVSPYEQGEMIGDMVINLIKTGRPAGDFEHIYPSQYVYSFNGNTVVNNSKIYNKSIGLVEAFARASNHYYQTIDG